MSKEAPKRAESLKSPEQIDVIVVHASGIEEWPTMRKGWWKEKPEKRLPKSTWDARTRVTAAGEIFETFKREGKKLKFVVVGGNCFPTLAPSMAEVLKEDLMRRFKVPEDDILLADQGGNTVLDFKLLRELIAGSNFHNVLNISSDWHKVPQVLSEKYNMHFIPAESVLEERNPRYRKIFKDIYSSGSIDLLVKNQKMGIMLMSVPVIGENLYSFYAQATLRFRAKIKKFDTNGLKKMTRKYQEPVLK